MSDIVQRERLELAETVRLEELEQVIERGRQVCALIGVDRAVFVLDADTLHAWGRYRQPGKRYVLFYFEAPGPGKYPALPSRLKPRDFQERWRRRESNPRKIPTSAQTRPLALRQRTARCRT